MNTTAKTLIQALVAGVALVVIGATLMNAAAPASPQKVVQLERVVITGKRLQAEPVQVAQLPRVIITGKRAADASAVQVAQLPQVVVLGKRMEVEPRMFAKLGRALSRIIKSA